MFNTASSAALRVGESWDWTQNCLDVGIGSQTFYYTLFMPTNIWINQRWASKLFWKSANRKSANYWANPLLQIRKLLMCANPQITNQQILKWLNCIFANFHKYWTRLSQNSSKCRFKMIFYFVQIWTRALYARFVRRKSMRLRTFGSFSPQFTIKIRSTQIANSRNATFAEGPQI